MTYDLHKVNQGIARVFTDSDFVMASLGQLAQTDGNTMDPSFWFTSATIVPQYLNFKTGIRFTLDLSMSLSGKGRGGERDLLNLTEILSYYEFRGKILVHA